MFVQIPSIFHRQGKLMRQPVFSPSTHGLLRVRRMCREITARIIPISFSGLSITTDSRPSVQIRNIRSLCSLRPINTLILNKKKNRVEPIVRFHPVMVLFPLRLTEIRRASFRQRKRFRPFRRDGNSRDWPDHMLSERILKGRFFPLSQGFFRLR